MWHLVDMIGEGYIFRATVTMQKPPLENVEIVFDYNTGVVLECSESLYIPEVSMMIIRLNKIYENYWLDDTYKETIPKKRQKLKRIKLVDIVLENNIITAKVSINTRPKEDFKISVDIVQKKIISCTRKKDFWVYHAFSRILEYDTQDLLKEDIKEWIGIKDVG